MDSSSSTPESVDVEKMMKNLKLKEKVEEISVTEAGDSSSSLTSKEEEEEDVMEIKNLKIQVTVQSSKSEEGEQVSAVLLGTPKSDSHEADTGGSAFVDEIKPKSMVILKISGGDTIEVEESIAMLSQKIKYMIEDGVVSGNEIQLTNTSIFSSEILERVFEFLEKHAEKEDLDEDEKQELKKWDEDFIEELKDDKGFLFGMMVAAFFLDAKFLLEVTCKTCADIIKDKSVEWVREYFGIVNDFTPEEEAAIRAENAWAFEDLNDDLC